MSFIFLSHKLMSFIFSRPRASCTTFWVAGLFGNVIWYWHWQTFDLAWSTGDIDLRPFYVRTFWKQQSWPRRLLNLSATCCELRQWVRSSTPLPSNLLVRPAWSSADLNFTKKSSVVTASKLQRQLLLLLLEKTNLSCRKQASSTGYKVSKAIEQ